MRISYKISLKLVPKGPINDIPALVQIMAWLRPGDKPLSEPVMVRLPTHICVIRPQWVNTYPLGLPMQLTNWLRGGAAVIILNFFREIALRWKPQDITLDQWTFLQVMACCHGCWCSVDVWGLFCSLPGSPQVEVLELHELQKEYILVDARLRLLKVEPDPAHMVGPTPSAEETVALLVNAGLFDVAIHLSHLFDLPLTPVFEELAGRWGRILTLVRAGASTEIMSTSIGKSVLK